MPDLLEQSAQWLRAMNRQFRGKTVVYRRGAAQKEIIATVGRTVFTVDTGYGLFERVESRDYLVDVEELADLGIPLRGDKVREAVGNSVHVFEVLAPGQEPHFRYSDPGRTVYRIHTKHVGTEPT